MEEMRCTPADDGCEFELLVNGQSASRLGVCTRHVRVGTRALRCGGIAGVGTQREYRRRGHARRLLREALRWMAAERFHLSILFGIPNFYHRFGYVACLIDSETRVATRNAQEAPACYTVRDARPEDHAAMARIYAAQHAGRTGTALREATSWPGLTRGAHWCDRVGTRVVVDGDTVVGYLGYNRFPHSPTVAEVGYRDAAVFGTLLAEAGALAAERIAEHVVLALPPDEPFVTYCLRYGCETTITYPRNRGGMARIIDQAGTLATLQPLLAERVRPLEARAPEALVVRTDLGEDRVALGGPARAIWLELNQGLLAQLLLGYRSAADALFQTGARASDGADEALQALFPVGWPYMYWDDRF